MGHSASRVFFSDPAGYSWDNSPLFFFLRKISPELTTANLPLFAEEDLP